LRDLPKLKRLRLSCDVADVDWGLLFNHPSLSDVALRSHAGYDVPNDRILRTAEGATRKVASFKRIGSKSIPAFAFDMK
jgi:hypothetical protein